MFGNLTSNFSFLLIREWLNGGLFPLSFMLAAILATFMINTRRLVGDGWTKEPGVSTACVLFWIFTADAWRAGSVWITLRVLNDGGSLPEWLEIATSLGFVLTAALLIGAMIRAIYMFTPRTLKNVYWIVSVVVTILFLIASHLLPPFPV